MRYRFAITRNRCEIAPQILRYRYRIVAGSLRNRCAIDLRFAIAAESLSNRRGITFKLPHNRCKITAKSL
jgi:hypothetical protein